MLERLKKLLGSKLAFAASDCGGSADGMYHSAVYGKHDKHARRVGKQYYFGNG